MTSAAQAGGAANFTWLGAAAPGPSTGNFTWQAGTPIMVTAAGEVLAKFGTPAATRALPMLGSFDFCWVGAHGPIAGSDFTWQPTAGAAQTAKAHGARFGAFGAPGVTSAAIVKASGRPLALFGKPVATQTTPGLCNFTWQGSVAPAAVAGGVANFAWGTASTPAARTRQAHGAAFLAFGTPTASTAAMPPARTMQAHGAAFLAFGAPSGQYRVAVQQHGTRLAKIGTPSATAGATFRASGAALTAFGTPIASTRLVGRPAGVALAKFGQPKASSTVQAQAKGSMLAKFGRPVVGLVMRAQSLAPNLQIPSPVARASFVGIAESAGRVGRVGRPIATAAVSAVASSLAPRTHFGNPKARSFSTNAANGDRFTQYGQPSAHTSFRAHGFQVVRFGTPLGNGTKFATGFRVAKFGKPKAIGGAQPRTKHAWGLNLSGRIGQPVAYSHIPHKTEGLRLCTFGTPSVRVALHALHLAPSTRFGRPRARRSPA